MPLSLSTVNKKIILLEKKLFQHLFQYQQRYFLLLLLILLTTPLLINFLNNDPLIMGRESYYHLQQAQNLDQWSYFPLSVITNVLSGDFLAIIPLLLAACCLLLFFKLKEQLHISPLFSLFFLLIMLFSPSFIFTFVTISAYAYFTFLLLLGFVMLTHHRQKYHYWSIIPFFLAAFIDLISTFLLLTVLIIYFYHYRQERPPFLVTLITIIVLVTLLNIFILDQAFMLGPFHPQQKIADLITDLGGRSGISFFVLIMALIGLVAARKDKTMYGAYLLTAVLIPAYIYNTQVIFPLTVMAVFFATIGFLTLFEKKWHVDTLRKLTLLLFILSVFFSSLSYLDRMTLIGPSGEEREVLHWISNNIPPQAVIFSAPENGDYINYFTQRPAFVTIRSDILIKNEFDKIMNSVYHNDLFPLLDKNNISVIYLTPALKEQLPVDYGLRILLKNEKFKLVHSREDIEVWVYR